MKPVLFVSLILTLAITLTACDNSSNADKGAEVSAQLNETGAKVSESAENISTTVATQAKQVNQSAQEATSDTTEIIEDNLESIQENVESNPWDHTNRQLFISWSTTWAWIANRRLLSQL